jgi:uncharacterized membrane protein
MVGILSPFFIETINIDFYYFLKMFFSPVCHQNPDKSFVINNLQFLVCSRCFGIYLGLIIASILSIIKFSKKIKLKFLLVSVLPIISDIIFYQVGFYSYNKILSMITGIIFGTITFLFIFEVITESVMKEKK